MSGVKSLISQFETNKGLDVSKNSAVPKRSFTKNSIISPQPDVSRLITKTDVKALEESLIKDNQKKILRHTNSLDQLEKAIRNSVYKEESATDNYSFSGYRVDSKHKLQKVGALVQQKEGEQPRSQGEVGKLIVRLRATNFHSESPASSQSETVFSSKRESNDKKTTKNDREESESPPLHEETVKEPTLSRPEEKCKVIDDDSNSVSSRKGSTNMLVSVKDINNTDKNGISTQESKDLHINVIPMPPTLSDSYKLDSPLTALMETTGEKSKGTSAKSLIDDLQNEILEMIDNSGGPVISGVSSIHSKMSSSTELNLNADSIGTQLIEKEKTNMVSKEKPLRVNTLITNNETQIPDTSANPIKKEVDGFHREHTGLRTPPVTSYSENSSYQTPRSHVQANNLFDEYQNSGDTPSTPAKMDESTRILETEEEKKPNESLPEINAKSKVLEDPKNKDIVHAAKLMTPIQFPAETFSDSGADVFATPPQFSQFSHLGANTNTAATFRKYEPEMRVVTKIEETIVDNHKQVKKRNKIPLFGFFMRDKKKESSSEKEVVSGKYLVGPIQSPYYHDEVVKKSKEDSPTGGFGSPNTPAKRMKSHYSSPNFSTRRQKVTTEMISYPESPERKVNYVPRRAAPIPSQSCLDLDNEKFTPKPRELGSPPERHSTQKISKATDESGQSKLPHTYRIFASNGDKRKSIRGKLLRRGTAKTVNTVDEAVQTDDSLTRVHSNEKSRSRKDVNLCLLPINDSKNELLESFLHEKNQTSLLNYFESFIEKSFV